MKKFALTLLMLAYGVTASAAIAVVQSNSTVGFSTVPFTVSFSALPAQHNAVAVTLCFRSNAQTGLTVTDNQGNTYTQVATGVLTGLSDGEIWIAYNIGAPTGTFTVTVTEGNTPSNYAAGIAEVSGLANTTDQAQGFSLATTSTTQTITMGSANTNANDLVIAVYCDHFTPSPRGLSHPPTASYTGDISYHDATSPTNLGTSDSAFKIVSSIETSSASWTTTGADSGAGVLATFKGAGSGSSCTHTAYTQLGTFAVPTPASTVVYRQDGNMGTVTCSGSGGASNSFWSPSQGLFVAQ